MSEYGILRGVLRVVLSVSLNVFSEIDKNFVLVVFIAFHILMLEYKVVRDR